MNDVDVKIQDGSYIFPAGRAVWVSRLWMEHTYDGCLEGTLETCSLYLRQNMKESMQYRFKQKVVVIESTENILPNITSRSFH
ncbi:hypothetical protein METHB2_190001 [Candidatus Methylobacter favarea]|uniref:Uncharacterized protein n=1 Tax=Candidatus Methylobacter favarea TaxID=2707345 RepID=A0A8S0XEV8_9GAMM|nr:hypothetical protein [Candidatus Methylobacter favarea]CAA9890114.1 hypothetical protein METHB2_190001 [Candidatus Methylobacter favarea]